MPEEMQRPGSCRCSRRSLIRLGAVIAGGMTAGVPLGALAGGAPPSPAQFGGQTPLPLPIPEIDKNGHHNVPPAPYAEPSEIFNFRGNVATAILAGTGHDNRGRAIKFGGPGTDVRFMQGEYVTGDGQHHRGTFIHI